MLAKFHLPPMLPGFTPHFNIAPSQQQWTILLDGSGAPAARQLKWGLVPSWASDPAVGNRLVNARSDSVATKPSYQESFRQRRCVVLADGFYEWSGSGKSKTPFFFHLADHSDFAFAGLWDRWEKNGVTLDTCTIITTDANAFASAVHDRMPVILKPNAAVEWLDSSASNKQLHDSMQPYTASDLVCHEVSSAVNSPLNDSDECIRIAPPKPPSLELSLFDT
jgi:putative SOS response-associated peptidase YedK